MYNLPPPASSKAPAVEPIKLLTLDLPGHRSDVRCLAVSSDDQLIASASHGTLKLWNVKTTKCVRTMDCGYAICCSFLPGDRHVSLNLCAAVLLYCLYGADHHIHRSWLVPNLASFSSTICLPLPSSRLSPPTLARSGLSTSVPTSEVS